MAKCPKCGDTLSMTYEDGGLSEPDYYCTNCQWQAGNDYFDSTSDEEGIGNSDAGGIDDKEYRKVRLSFLLERAEEAPFEAMILKGIVEPLFNPAIRKSEKRLLHFEGGDIFEFYDVGGEFITRLIKTGAQPSGWYLSDKMTAISELTRVLGKQLKELEQFSEDYDYDDYPTGGASLEYFTADYMEKGFGSKSLEIAVVADNLFAYWISGINGTIERGWLTIEQIAETVSRFRAIYSR